MEFGELINPRERNGESVHPAAVVHACTACGSALQPGLDTYTDSEVVRFTTRGGRSKKRHRRDTSGAVIGYCSECDCITDDLPFSIKCPRCAESMLDFGAYDASAGTMRVSCADADCKWAGWWMVPDRMLELDTRQIVMERIAREQAAAAELESELAAVGDGLAFRLYERVELAEDGSVWACDAMLEGLTADGWLQLDAGPAPEKSVDDLVLELVKVRKDSFMRDTQAVIMDCKRWGDSVAIADILHEVDALLG